jgi:phage-related protein
VASEAEVDLVISTANALPQLERDLREIIDTAEADADAVELQALLDADESLSNLISDMDAVLRDAELAADPIAIQARLEQAESLDQLRDDLRTLITEAEFAASEIELEAQLDPDIAALDAEIAALVAELEASAPPIELEVDVDRDGRAAASAGRLGKALTAMTGPLKGLGAVFGGFSAATSILPILAGTTAALNQLAPAAAVAVPALTSLVLVSGTLKLAMQGVGDAVKGAFDPDTKPEDLAKAMEGLAPSARAFVTELAGMKSQLKEIQQTVQENFFKGLDGALKVLGQRTLPIVAGALKETATTLNLMAHEAASAALELGNSGTLGKALEGANAGLSNLIPIPGLIVTALGQIGAAASPAFDRITTGATKAAEAVADKLSKAFESGGLEDAINVAVDSFVQLGRIIGNVFEGLGNVLKSFAQTGDGVFASLEKITQAFADVTATKGFQDALSALSTTMSTVLSAVLPLISQALQALGPVFQALAPPVQELVKALAAGLKPVIAALGPVLVSLAAAAGKLVPALTPIINLASKLLVAVLPALIPLFDALGMAIQAVTPFIEQLATNLAAQLVPLFTTLATQVLPQLLPPLVQLTTAIFPVLTKILVALAPSLVKLGEAFANILVALTPVLVELTNLTIKLGQELMPLLEPLISLVLRFVTGALGVLVAQLNGIVVPALRILVNLLKGDFSAAFEGAKTLVANVWAKITELTAIMVRAIADKLLSLVGLTTERVGQIRDRAVEGFQRMVDRAAEEVGKLPGRITSALGDLGNLLYSKGADVVRGFIDGLSSQLGRLRDVAGQIASAVTNPVGFLLDMHSPSRVMREMGQNTIEGFRLGIRDGINDTVAQMRSIAAIAPVIAGQSNIGSLAVPQGASMAPTVQVFLGNQLLDQHVDTRIAASNQARDRLIINGGRR